MKIASKLFLAASITLYILSFPLMAMDPQEGDKGKSAPHPTPTVTAPQVPQQGSNNGQQSLSLQPSSEDQNKGNPPQVTCFNLKQELAKEDLFLASDKCLLDALKAQLPSFPVRAIRYINAAPAEFAHSKWLAAPQPTVVSFAHCFLDQSLVDCCYKNAPRHARLKAPESVKQLCLSGNNFDERAIGNLLKFSGYNPTTLHVGHNRVSSPDLSGDLPTDSLTYFYCGDNPLTDEGMADASDFFMNRLLPLREFYAHNGKYGWGGIDLMFRGTTNFTRTRFPRRQGFVSHSRDTGPFCMSRLECLSIDAPNLTEPEISIIADNLAVSIRICVLNGAPNEVLKTLHAQIMKVREERVAYDTRGKSKEVIPITLLGSFPPDCVDEHGNPSLRPLLKKQAKPEGKENGNGQT